MGKFQYSLSQQISISNFTTSGIFDHTFIHSQASAIDDFAEKRAALFILLRPYEQDINNIPYELTNMILLGCISAVESYVRKIIRTVIIVDKSSRKFSEGQTVKYGAVISHEKSMLPEALLESYSFTNAQNIKETIKSLTGIACNKNQPLNTSLTEYSKICQLRHCVVHRFGFLGSNNAMELGLDEHKEYLEKPLKINFDKLNEIVQVCQNVVKTINNHIFCEMMERIYQERTESWKFDYRKDKKTFLKYFNLFKDSSNGLDEKLVYKEFISVMSKVHGRNF